jgi:hypothetical protein
MKDEIRKPETRNLKREPRRRGTRPRVPGIFFAHRSPRHPFHPPVHGGSSSPSPIPWGKLERVGRCLTNTDYSESTVTQAESSRSPQLKYTHWNPQQSGHHQKREQPVESVRAGRGLIRPLGTESRIVTPGIPSSHEPLTQTVIRVESGWPGPTCKSGLLTPIQMLPMVCPEMTTGSESVQEASPPLAVTYATPGIPLERK